MLGAYRDRLLRPMSVVRDYYLPGWIGEGTLVILSSYSGDTEETLTCASQGLERTSASPTRPAGKLGRFYAAEGVPVIALPPGLPRAALLRLLVPVAVLLDRVGAVPPLGSDLQEARETIAASVAALGTRCRSRATRRSSSPAPWRVPLFWGAGSTARSPTAGAARWPRTPSCRVVRGAAELDHNDIVGLSGTPARSPT